eukprot:g77789.t1
MSCRGFGFKPRHLSIIRFKRKSQSVTRQDPKLNTMLEETASLVFDEVVPLMELAALEADLWLEQQMFLAKWHPKSPWGEMEINRIARKHARQLSK